MKHPGATKRLSLRRETLRRHTRELTEHQLAKALGGGDVDGGPLVQSTNTKPPDDTETMGS